MKKALVIIDLQEGFINKSTKRLPSRIKSFIKRHGQDYAVVLFTQYKNYPGSNFVKNLNYTSFMEKRENELVPDIKEFINKKNVFVKDTYGSFIDNKVSNILRKNEIKEVDLAGVDTENCVLTFARDAFDRGYRINVLKNLCASHSSPKLHRAALEIIKYNIGNLK